MLRTKRCPRVRELEEYREGSLRPERDETIKRHLDACARCRRLLAQDGRLSALLHQADPAKPVPAERVVEQKAGLLERCARSVDAGRERQPWPFSASGSWWLLPRPVFAAALALALLGLLLVSRWALPPPGPTPPRVAIEPESPTRDLAPPRNRLPYLPENRSQGLKTRGNVEPRISEQRPDSPRRRRRAPGPHLARAETPHREHHRSDTTSTARSRRRPVVASPTRRSRPQPHLAERLVIQAEGPPDERTASVLSLTVVAHGDPAKEEGYVAVIRSERKEVIP